MVESHEKGFLGLNDMKCINRYALIVRPKKPFLDWVNFNDPEHPMTLAEIREEPNAYLLPEIEDSGEQQNYLEENCGEIFRHELYGCYTDEKLFPKDLSWNFFVEWFDWEILSMVIDTLDRPIRKEAVD